MAAVATIALSDAQGSPVVHNFVPLYQDPDGTWWYEDQSPTNAIGYNRISLKLTRPAPATPGVNSSNRMNRVKMTLFLPTMRTLGTNDAGITPPPTVAYVERASVEYMLPEEATLQNRKDVRKYVQFLQADAQVVGMVETLAGVY